MTKGRSPSVKQILVRDFNWRMGNLRRIEKSVFALDSDLAFQIQELVKKQMDREQWRHEGRLDVLKYGVLRSPNDEILARAESEAHFNSLNK